MWRSVSLFFLVVLGESGFNVYTRIPFASVEHHARKLETLIQLAACTMAGGSSQLLAKRWRQSRKFEDLGASEYLNSKDRTNGQYSVSSHFLNHRL